MIRIWLSYLLICSCPLFSDEEIPSDTEDEIESEKDDEDEDGAPARKRMKVSEYEKEISERHKRFQDFCNRTLNMWNEKTRLASGRLNAKSGGFGAFDQSILKQIEGILADKQRLINRTRIKRSTYRILGSQPKSKEVVPPPNSENMVSLDFLNIKDFVLSVKLFKSLF